MTDPENATLELRFKVTSYSTGEANTYRQRIRLSITTPHYGGKRWWMHRPRTGRASASFTAQAAPIFRQLLFYNELKYRLF